MSERHEPMTDDESYRLDVQAARLAGYTQEAAEAVVHRMRQQRQQERDYPRLLAEVERLRAEVKQAREAALDEVQEFVVAHAFDTSVGRRIDDFITALLAEGKGQ